MFRVPSAESENSNSSVASSNMPTATTAVDQESASSSQSSAVTAPNMSTTANSADYNDMDMSENNVPESSLPAPKEESIFSSMTSSSSSSSTPPTTPPTQVTGKTTARCPKGSRRNKKSGNCDPAPRKSKGNRKSNNGQITRKKETTNIGRIRALEHTQDAILAKLMELEEAKK
jgi:hypothetical protein